MPTCSPPKSLESRLEGLVAQEYAEACLADALKLFLVGRLVVGCHGNCSPVSRADAARVSSIGHYQRVSFDKGDHLQDIN